MAAATALAIVGVVMLEPGITARTPERTSPSTPRPTAIVAPSVEAAAQVVLTPGAAVLPPGVTTVPTPDETPVVEPADDVWLLTPDEAEVGAHLPPVAIVPESLGGSVVFVDTPTAIEPAAPAQVAHQSYRRPTESRPSPNARPSGGSQSGGSQSGGGTGGQDVSPAAWHVAPTVTWYGPGFYGHMTACGLRLTRTIVGVAHKSLPCGTLIQFTWRGMTHTAPVIDRGPFAGPGYIFDWSAAMACHLFRPHGVSNSCYTRHDVKWRVVGHRALHHRRHN